MTSAEKTVEAAPAAPSFQEAFLALVRSVPDKGVFALILLAWLALFHFYGNSTLGYVNTQSLFGWMRYAYSMGVDDQLGYFMPFVIIALMWWKRQDLMIVQKRVWWPALALVVLGLVVHVLGFLVQQTRISIIGFFTGLYGLTGLVWGPQWLRATFFPFFLFAFCVPLGNTAERITLPLRILATKISVGLCHGALGIDVIRKGTMIWDPAGRFQYEIAAACSGIRSLTAFLAFTMIFSFVFLQATWRRLFLIGMAFPLAVASNVFRLLMIIIAAEVWGQKAGNWVHENTWMSLVPYVPTLVVVLLLGNWLQEKPRKEEA